MSASVESRIVYMQFDNADFERKSKQTLQTLENLQNGLDMEEAAKKFEKLDDAANSVNLKGLTQSVTTLTQSFSAGEIMAKRFFENVTDWAMSATDKLMQMSKVDIVGGWNKYNQELQGVQTIFSALPDETDEHVQAILDKLLWYTDETSYRYSDLVSNIAKFTNAGVSLEDATTALIGIANLTASAGQNAEAASHAMEAFSKAMARGQFDSRTMMQLSTFNINTKAFADTMYKYGKELGTIQEGAYNSATEALSDAAKWSNNEIVLKTLKEYGVYTDEVYKEYEKTGKMAFEIMRELDATGMELSANAMKRAQETKTLADYVDYIHETIATGWKTTFSTIVGDYHEATEFWSNLAEETYPLITSIRDVRNETAKYFKDMGGREKIVSVSEKSLGILDKTLGILKDSVNETTKEFFGFSLDLDDASTNAEKLYDIFDKIDKKLDEVKASEGWQTFKTVSSDIFNTIANLGKWGFDTLRKIGKVIAPIFDKVNGASKTVLGKDLIVLIPIISKLANKLSGLGYAISPLGFFITFLVKSFTEFGESLETFMIDLSNDVGPIVNGALNILKKVYEFIDALMDYLMPVWKVVGAVVKLVAQALHIIVTAANKVINKLPFTSWLKNATEQGSAFAGICDRIAGAINWVTKKLHDLFFGYDDVSNAMNETGESGVKHMMGWLNYIDKAMKKLHDWWEGLSGFKKAFYDVYEVSKNSIKNISFSTVGEALKKYWTEIVPAFFKKMGNTIKTWWSSLSSNKNESFKIGAFTVEGFIEGVKSTAVKIWEVLKSVFSKVITFVMGIFDIHSPSKIFAAIGAFVIAGFIGGILSSAKDMNKTTGEVFSSFTDSIKKMFDFKDPQGAMGGALDSVKGFFGIIGEIFKQFYEFVKEAGDGNIFAGVLDIFRQLGEGSALFGVGDAGKGLKKMPSALSSAADSLSKITDFNIKLTANGVNPPKKGWGEQFKELGKGLLLMVAAFALLAYAISKFDQGTIDTTLLVLAAILGGFTALSNSMNSTSSALTKDIGTVILKVAASILIIAIAFKKILKAIDKADDPNSWWKATIVIGIMVVAMVGVIKYLTTLQSKTKGIGDQSFKSIGLALLAVSAAMLIMAMAFKKILKAIDNADNPNAWWQALIVMGLMVAAAMGFFALMVYLKTKGDKAGRTTEPKTFIKFAEALMIVSAAIYVIALAISKVIKAVSKYGIESAAVAVVALIAVMVVIGLLFTAVSKLNLDTDKIKQFAIATLIFGAAMAIIAVVLGMLSKMDWETFGDSIGKMVVVLALLMVVGLLSSGKIGDGLIKFGKAMEYVGIALLAVAAAFLLSAIAIRILFNALVYAASNADAIIAGLSVMKEVLSGFIIEIMKATANGLLEIVPVLVQILIEFIVASLEGIRDSIGTIGKVIFEILIAILDLLIEYIPDVISKFMTVVKIFLEALVEGFRQIPPGVLLEILENVTAITAILAEMTLWAGLGIGALVGVIVGLVPAFVALTALFEVLSWLYNNTDALSVIEAGGELLQALGNAIGKGIGGLIGGIGEALADSLPHIAEKMSEFAIAIQPFLVLASKVTDEMLSGTGRLVAIIIEFAIAEIIDALATFISNNVGSNIVDTATKMAEFALAMQPYLMIMSKFGKGNGLSAAVNATKQLMDIVLLFAATEFIGAISNFLGINHGLDDLPQKFGHLGDAIKKFYMKIKYIPDEHLKRLETSAKALSYVVSAMNEIPSEGGFVGFITGNHDYSTFGESMGQIGAGVKAFYEACKDIDNLKAFDDYCEKLKLLVETMNLIPKEGGVAQFFSGERDFDGFSTSMASIGKGLVEFYKAFDSVQIDTNGRHVRYEKMTLEKFNDRAEILKSMIDIMNSLGKEGGVAQLFTGSQESGYNAFIDAIPRTGVALRTFYHDTHDIKKGLISEITDSLSDFVELCKSSTDDVILDRIAESIDKLTVTVKAAKDIKMCTFIADFALNLTELGSALDNIDLSKFAATLSLINTLMDELPSDPVVTPVLDARDFMTGIALMGRAINGGNFSIDTSGVSQATASMAGAESSGGNVIEITNNYTVDELTPLEAYKNTRDTTRLIKIGLR